jgi:hypothetical protein
MLFLKERRLLPNMFIIQKLLQRMNIDRTRRRHRPTVRTRLGKRLIQYGNHGNGIKAMRMDGGNVLNPFAILLICFW